jgi:hypothetical protein
MNIARRPEFKGIYQRKENKSRKFATGVEDLSASAEGIHKVLDWWSGTAVPPSVASFLKAHGADPITSLAVGRTPISKTLDLALDVISGGKFGQIKKKLGYDQFFHLFIIVNGKHRIEKNELFNIIPYSKASDEEDVPVDLGGKQITISEFLENGSKGDETNFYRHYNAFGANCQAMVLKLLSRNHLMTPAIQAFVKQNVEEYAREHDLLGTAKAITDVGSVLNRLLQLATGGKRHFSVGGVVGRRQFRHKSFL